MKTYHKYSNLILKLKGFKFERENDNAITYKKTITSKDALNYYMEYYIYYTWHKKEKWAEVYIGSWTSRYGTKDRGYDFYTGKQEKIGQQILNELKIKIRGLIYE